MNYIIVASNRSSSRVFLQSHSRVIGVGLIDYRHEWLFILSMTKVTNHFYSLHPVVAWVRTGPQYVPLPVVKMRLPVNG